MKRIAKVFLYIIATLYLLLGIGVASLFGIIFAAIFLEAGGFYILVMPLPLLVDTFAASAGGFAAIILSIVGLTALGNAKKSPQWMYAWYGLSALAFLISLFNLFTLHGPLPFPFEKVSYSPIIPMNFVSSFLYLLATYIVHRDALQSKDQLT